uniref:Secreted protein n=1 Tax=Parascaris equorum TaxID=6256 RepID=A0A914R6Z3_PAREQ
MLHYVVFLALLSVSFAELEQQQPQPQLRATQCSYPNGTATAIHTFNCNASMISPVDLIVVRELSKDNFKCLGKLHFTVGLCLESKMIVKSTKVLGADGKEMYPINFKEPITIVLDAENNGEVVSKSIAA